MRRGTSYKFGLLFLAALLLVTAAWSQRQLNRDRGELGLTRMTPLENAPPVLAFTTVALGGFRGLIANALWIRATELQDEGKYFEMVQLANWITQLQPQFKAVWIHQAWNLVYNISIKFSDYPERWRWVRQGIELLRDEGLRYNPEEPDMYRELAWFFQHKIGFYLDDAHLYYKHAWAEEMNQVLGSGRPNFDALLHPQTDEDKARVQLLKEKYKLDPQFMKTVDDTYGPMEWRLPEAHAIYWAMLGMDRTKKKDDLMVLRRVVYQSMQLSFQRGRLIENKFDGTLEYGPNLDIIPNANRSYENMMEQDAENRDHIKIAHRNFLKDAVYFLYTNNRLTEAGKWFKYLGDQYPDKPLLNDPGSLPATLTLDEYAISRVNEDVSETSMDRVTMVIQGLWMRSFYCLVIGQDSEAEGCARLAQKVWNRYERQTAGQQKRVGLSPLNAIRQSALNQVLDPKEGFSPAMADVLRTKLGLPAPSTNAPPPAAGAPALK